MDKCANRVAEKKTDMMKQAPIKAGKVVLCDPGDFLSEPGMDIAAGSD